MMKRRDLRYGCNATGRKRVSEWPGGSCVGGSAAAVDLITYLQNLVRARALVVKVHGLVKCWRKRAFKYHCSSSCCVLGGGGGVKRT